MKQKNKKSVKKTRVICECGMEKFIELNELGDNIKLKYCTRCQPTLSYSGQVIKFK